MDASLKLFGVQLKGADRKTFRVALLNDGLKLLRAGDWVDQYSPKGTLEGATVFEGGYAPGEDRLAYGEYTFTSFRSEKRRVGKEWVCTCRSRWSAKH